MNMEASKANEIALKERKDTHNLDDFSTMQKHDTFSRKEAEDEKTSRKEH